MFERIGRLAERAANGVGVSRRGFLGRLGQSAAGFVGVLAGLAATTATAKGGGSYVCCAWKCPNLYKGRNSYTRKFCLPPGSTCGTGPYSIPCFGGVFLGQTTVNDCKSCK
jgi:hypothetical protein